MTLFNVRCARRIACTLAHFDVRTCTLNNILCSLSRCVMRTSNITMLLYLCLHRLMQNDQIRHGNTWRGRDFRRSAKSLHLYKCQTDIAEIQIVQHSYIITVHAIAVSAVIEDSIFIMHPKDMAHSSTNTFL